MKARTVTSVPCGCGKCIDCEFGSGRKTIVSTTESIPDPTPDTDQRAKDQVLAAALPERVDQLLEMCDGLREMCERGELYYLNPRVENAALRPFEGHNGLAVATGELRLALDAYRRTRGLTHSG